MKAHNLPTSVDEPAEPTSAPPDISPLSRTAQLLKLRALALTSILILSGLFTLKIASSFFIPVALAMLLSFVFASTIRFLEKLWIPAPLGAVIVVGCLIGGISFGVYRLASPARDWMGKLAEAARDGQPKIREVQQTV